MQNVEPSEPCGDDRAPAAVTRRWPTRVTDLIDVRLPVVLAPMGGGPCTPDLVAAVGDAGGLGSLAAGYLSPGRILADVAAIRAKTSAPFAVNLFAADAAQVAAGDMAAALAAIAPLRVELGLTPEPDVSVIAESLDGQLQALLSGPPRVVSFTFGIPDSDVVDALHSAGCLLVGTATTTEEARTVEAAGFDAVCVQGAEAGAHRGTFLSGSAGSLVGTLALVPQVCDSVNIPVIASGGIMDGRGLAASLALGAGAAQLGTAFLRCPEAGTALAYRQALASAADTSTALTSAVTGRMARGIENRLMRTLEGGRVPPYPVMHALTAELRRTAAAQGIADLMSLWCGQAVAMGTDLPAGEVVQRLVAEALGVFREAPTDLVDDEVC